MARTSIVFAVAASLTFIAGCTQDFNKFLSTGAGGMGSSSSQSGSASSSSGGCDPMACPAPMAECDQAACTAGMCGSSHKTAGAMCAGNTKVCDGNGNCVACNAPADCPKQATACIADTCTMNACGTMNAASATACTDNGGKLCDGAGKCVACLMPTDCPAQTTTCKTNTCDTMHVCGTMNAAKGTACTDNGGVTCDGNGTCVAMHCMDMVKDADETDVDCGGATCAKCADNLGCNTGADCQSGVCGMNKKCTPPSCTDGLKNGLETDLDCGGATCDALGASGKCADMKHCAVAADCKNGFCFGSGTTAICTSCMDGVKDGNETDLDCGGAQCDAAGKTCATGKMCLVNADCASDFCGPGNTCQLKADGATCAAGTQCTSGACVGVQGMAGTSVCCATACTDAGAMSCGNDGKCMANGSACTNYQAGTTCVGASCTSGNLTPARTCNGTGNCQMTTAAPCTGALACASGSACLGACANDNQCADPTNNYCVLPGGASCMAKGMAGAMCAANDQCTTNKCGTSGTGHCCTASCLATGVCGGATDCTATGACAYPPASTSCAACGGANNNTLTPGMCDGSGTCNAGTGAACAGNLTCASTMACRQGCGTADPTGDSHCYPSGGASGFYCDGAGSGATMGVCQATKAPGATCARNGECQSGTCKTNMTCQ